MAFMFACVNVYMLYWLNSEGKMLVVRCGTVRFTENDQLKQI